MGLFNNMLKTLSPGLAAKRADARMRLEESEMKHDALRAKRSMLDDIISESYMGHTNSGYSHGGASRKRRWAKKYNSTSLSPESDIEENRKTLRERSRDLYMNTPLGAAAVSSTRTNCVGSGLVPKPKIDYEFLGITEEEAKKLEKQIKKEFALWAESTLCDNNDQNNFYELQQIAFADWLKNGEEFALIKYDEKALPDMPYRLRIKLVEADRICTPGSYDGSYDGFNTVKKNGNSIMNGVEINKSGKVIAYHICSQFPGEYNGGGYDWQRIEKRGKKTGNPNILHIFNGERAGQYRGVPFLAPVIQTLKQLTRYTEAEIMAAIINSMFSIFVQTENGEGVTDFSGADEEGEVQDNGLKDDEVEFGYGTINFLKTGESVHSVESAHPSNGYDAFAFTMASHIGAALEVAPEVLLKKFTNNFSASKGALNETWKAFRMRRKWFINDFCQEVYVLWFNEAVSTGRLKAPGYFNSPLVKKAYTNTTWNGPAQGMLNPVQEVSAAVGRISEGLSTHEDECIALNGSDFDDNVRTLKNENAVLAEAKAACMPAVKQEGGTDGKD